MQFVQLNEITSLSPALWAVVRRPYHTRLQRHQGRVLGSQRKRIKVHAIQTKALFMFLQKDRRCRGPIIFCWQTWKQLRSAKNLPKISSILNILFYYLPWSLSESETSTSKICKWWRFHRWKSSKLLFKNSQTNMNFCNVFQPCLVITIDDKHYLVDTGFGRRSPRSSFYCSLRAALWSFTLAQLSQLMIDWNLITCPPWHFFVILNRYSLISFTQML